MNETVPESICSIVRDFFVRFVLLLQNAFLRLYFVPRASKRVETAWEGFSEAQERVGPRKIYLGVIFREKRGAESHSNFPGGVSGAGGSSHKYVLGRPMSWPRPGSTDCPGARRQKARGGQGPGSVEGSRFESGVTLQVTMFILYCKETTWKKGD